MVIPAKRCVFAGSAGTFAFHREFPTEVRGKFIRHARDRREPDLTVRPILLVDDEQYIRTVLGRVLIRAGYDVLEAANGEQALEIVRSTKVAAVLLDLRMPGKPGDEVLTELRNLDADLPVIMVSGALDARMKAHLLQLGATTCIDKPIHQTKLLRALDAALR